MAEPSTGSKRKDPLEPEAMKIIGYYAKWAAGAGAIPAPIIDVAAATAVQIKMLKRLAALYDVNYDENSGKAFLLGVVGSYLPARIGYGSIGFGIKTIPAVGGLLGLITVPAFNAGSTWAIGKYVRRHLGEEGGTFVNISVDKARASMPSTVVQA